MNNERSRYECISRYKRFKLMTGVDMRVVDM